MFALLVAHLSSSLSADSLRRLTRFAESRRWLLNEEVTWHLSIVETEGLKDFWAMRKTGPAYHGTAENLSKPRNGFRITGEEVPAPQKMPPDNGVWLSVPLSDFHQEAQHRMPRD